MIPIHPFNNNPKSEIRVIHLSHRTEYDTSAAHRHEYFELFVFENGGGNHMIDFVDFPIESGSIHLVAPGQVHKVVRELDSDGYVVLFELSVFDGNGLVSSFLYDHIALSVEERSPVYTFQDEQRQRMLSILSDMYRDMSGESVYKNDFIFNNLSQICLLCLQSIGQEEELIRQLDLYRDFRRLVFQNYRDIKKVADYAAELNVSVKQLGEVTNTRCGLTPLQLIHQQICIEAKRLLKNGLSAKEVAFDLKFEDPSHFSKFFKKQTGKSPSDFQNRHA